MKKGHSVFWVILAVLVALTVLALPAPAAQRKNPCKGKQPVAPLCCRVVTRGYRPGHWQTREDALAVWSTIVSTGQGNKPDYKLEQRPTSTAKVCLARGRQSNGKGK